MTAALAPVGVPNADIIVCDIKGAKLAAIQVKARREIGSDGGWHMKDKHEGITGDRLFYCLVDFGKELRTLRDAGLSRVKSSLASSLIHMRFGLKHQGATADLIKRLP